jgi:hypothetical protein
MPFQIELPLIEVQKDVTDREVILHSREFLKQLQEDVVPVDHKPLDEFFQSQKERKSHEIEKKINKYLRHVAEYPLFNITSRLEELNLSAAENEKIMRLVESRGLVRRVTIQTGHRGGQPRFVEFTTKGISYVHDVLGIKTTHLNKGIEHFFWQIQIKAWLSVVKGADVRLEAVITNTRVDILVQLGDKLFAIEVAMSPDHELENIRRDLAAGCSKVIVALRNWIGINSIRKELQRIDLESKVIFILAKNFKKELDWIVSVLK